MAWLKSRELLGEKRKSARLWLLAALFLGWCVLLYVGANRLYSEELDDALTVLTVSTAALWPLWALVPLAGGGAGEVTSASRLSPYPVSSRSQMFAALISAFLDFPFLIGLPLVVAISAVHTGIPGVLVALAFALGAACVGQLGAWAAAIFLARREHPGASIIAPVVLLVAFAFVLPYSLPEGSSMASILPGSWMVNALASLGQGDLLMAALWTFLLVLPVIVFFVFCPMLVTRALEAQASSTGQRATPWRGPSRLPGTFLLVVRSTLRSTLRAASTQAALAGALAAPFLIQLPFSDSETTISLDALGLFACLAAGASLALNLFAFDAGGALVFLAAPLTSRSLLLAKAFSGVLIITVVQWVVLTVSFLFSSDPLSAWALAMAASPFRALLVVGVGLRWSTRHPTAVDVESLRNKIATPWSVMTYMATCAVLIGFLEVPRQVLGVPGQVGSLVACIVIFLFWWMISAGSLTREGRSRVAVAARG